MFNAFVFVGDRDTGYTLFASQRKIYNDEYITGLFANDELITTKLNQRGKQIYNDWNIQWNREGGRIIWDFEDCWPIFLLDDARDLITYFETRYRVDIQKLV